MNFLEIEKVVGREILDSRGNPTVEAEVTLVERNLAHEEEKKERKLCKMGIYLYSSVFHNIFNFFSDSVSRYGKV